MKRAKLIPSILMLVLCTAVLAVGIYAASPTSHSIVGTVNITAGGANVSITGYLDDGDGVYTDDVKVTDTYTSRTSQTISIYANALDFDCSSASDIAEVAEKKLYFKVENHSGFSLGAYFLEGTVPESGTTSSNIAESKNFNGTMGSQTITNLITATFTTYSEVPANGSTKMYSTLKLNQLNSEASTVTLNLNLNIEKFNEELAPASENSVQVKNSEAVNVLVSCELQNASTTSTKSISNSGVWEAGTLAFSDETFNGQLRLQTVKMKMLVTNNHSKPISVSIIEDDENEGQPSSVLVTTTSCSYIAVGATEEVSIQFAAVFDRGTSQSLVEPVIPTINPYNYNVTIVEVSEPSTVLSRIKYDSTGIANGTMHYYVEYGDNPYVANEKLRWYIWAKDVGTGAPTALVSGTDYDSSTNTFKSTGSTYYFISQYILDVEDANYGLSFQNEYDVTKYYNANGDNINANDYASSNLRNYLNGLTVKRTYVNDSSGNYLANGSNVNFLDKYNLTDDALYAQINSRTLENLYANMGPTVAVPSTYSGQADKFWLLSAIDWGYIKSLGSNVPANLIAYKLSSTSSEGHWWLRTCSSNFKNYFVNTGGSQNINAHVYLDDVGTRPAFQIKI